MEILLFLKRNTTYNTLSSNHCVSQSVMSGEFRVRTADSMLQTSLEELGMDLKM